MHTSPTRSLHPRLPILRLLGILAALATFFALLAPQYTASGQTAVRPDPPSITSVMPGDGQATLVWKAGSNGGSSVLRWEYTYSEDGSAINLPLPILGSGSGTTRHTVTGLKNGAAYVFNVRAVNTVGSGGYSEDSDEVVPSTVPKAPAALKAVSANSKIGLYWTEAAADEMARTPQNGHSPITRYEYRWRTVGGSYPSWTPMILDSPATAGSETADNDMDFQGADPDFVVTGLNNGLAYQFQVRAVNAVGVGMGSETPIVTVASRPAAPRPLSAAPNDGSTDLVWVTGWDGGSPIIAYDLQILHLGGGATCAEAGTTSSVWSRIPGSGPTTTSYTVNVDSDTSYCFRVRAVNAIGPGAPAETTEAAAGMKPGAPSDLSGMASESSVTLTWTMPTDMGTTDITGYEYARKQGDSAYGNWMAVPANMLLNADDGTEADPGSTENLKFTVTRLARGTAYLFKVRAVNDAGPGGEVEMADPASPGTTPSAPASLRARPSYDRLTGEAQIALSWTPGSDGGSAITKWEYVSAQSLLDLSRKMVGDASWVTICDNSEGASPGCGSISSVTLPREGAQASSDAVLKMALMSGMESADTTDDQHYFVIRGSNAIGAGFVSGTTSAKFAVTVPSAPPAVYVQTTTASSIDLVWRPSGAGGSPITQYEYAVKVGSGGWGSWMSAGTDTFASHTVSDGLADGTMHMFRVRAVNGIGQGAHAESPSVAAGAPGSPGANDLTADAVEIGGVEYDAPALVAVPSAGRVTLRLVGTTGNAGSAKWEYSYKVDGGTWGTWTHDNHTGAYPSSGIQVEGLASGGSHMFRVRALNGNFASPVVESNATVPGVKPPAPQGLAASPGDKEITLSWISGGSGGPPIMNWEYCLVVADACGPESRSDANGWMEIPESGPDTASYTVTGLTNGKSYAYRVRAVNKIGAGARAESRPTSPGEPPGKPLAVSLAAGDGQIVVTVRRPSNADRGDTVIGYQVRYKQGNGAYGEWQTLGTTVKPPAVPSAQSGAAVGGLLNGALHTFQVAAVNAFGAGPEIESNELAPVGVPALRVVDASPSDGSVELSWPAGSVDIDNWQHSMRNVSQNAGYSSWMDIPGSGANTDSHTVTGLSNGIEYQFRIRAVKAGQGTTPFDSPIAIPSATPPAPDVMVFRGDGTANLSWTPGMSGAPGEADYASPTTGWQYRMMPSGGEYTEWMDVESSDGQTSKHSVGDLENGTEYVFEVRAVNATGEGAAGISEPVTPATTPDAPEVAAAATSEQVVLSWTAGDNGGSPITAWHLRIDDGEWNDLTDAGVNSDSTSFTVTDLENGTAYTIELRAINDVGDGLAASVESTPGAPPAAPEVAAAAGDGAVVLSWTAGDDGGSPVTAWHLRIDDGEPMDLSEMVDGNNLHYTVDRLENGQSYVFDVAAANEFGVGAYGRAEATPASAPSAPEVSAVGSNGEIRVHWDAPYDGGSRIVAWQHRTSLGLGVYGEWTDVLNDGAARKFTVLGLDTGTGALAYTFQVRAVNGIGAGEVGTSNVATPTITQMGGDLFYTGIIDSPEFCTDFSLGGAHLIAHDSDGDGVADVCSLPYTRREAIARQSAVDALIIRYAGEYTRIVNALCAMSDGEGTCGRDVLAPPPIVPANDGGPFYSGVITGPNFCANFSLGGPTTYPHDSDGDGVSDVCSLPYTRHEAIARQKAGDILSARHADEFRYQVSFACRSLTGGDYGDSPESLTADTCAR